jgi:hypothetical protein
MYSHGFDFVFFMKNLALTIVIGVLSWYFIVPLFMGASRVQGLASIVGISILTIIPFLFMNLKEGKMFIGELKKMKK